MLNEVLWKTVYRTGDDDLLKDFYLPALSHAKNYDRAVGYFSSELLASAAQGLSNLVKSDGKMRLIIGHPLDEEEYQAVVQGQKNSWLTGQLKDQLIEFMSAPQSTLSNYRLRLLSWLVAGGRLELKFACRRRGMYHEKIGVVTDSLGNKLVFQGSANETGFAMDANFNAESISVYPSWTDAYPTYGKIYEDAFESLWNGKQRDTVTLEMPSSFYEEIAKQVATNPALNFEIESEIFEQAQLASGIYSNENGPAVPSVLGNERFAIKPHQRRALEAWERNSFTGIMKLATGSGKTITAIYGAVRIFESTGQLCLIIAVPYIDLARQWVAVLRLFNIFPIQCYESKAKWSHKLTEQVAFYKTGQSSFLPVVVVNKTLSSDSFQSIIKTVPPERMLMIGDECHRHGATNAFAALPNAAMRLGLSATPFNDDDDEFDTPFPNVAKDRLLNYYGEIVSEYELSDAIHDGVLTQYNYHVYPVALTEEEQIEYEELSKKISGLIGSAKDGASDSLTILCGQRSRLLGEAENKFLMLRSLLKADGGVSKGHCLFYCPEGSAETASGISRNVDRVCSVLNEFGWRTSQFTSSESKTQRDNIMNGFLRKDIDGLVAMKVLDEGIDLPACKTAFILASTRNPRQYVQRRGRILRRYPGKLMAEIHDFVICPAAGYEDTNASLSLRRAELERVRDFQLMSFNRTEVSRSLSDMGYE